MDPAQTFFSFWPGQHPFGKSALDPGHGSRAYFSPYAKINQPQVPVTSNAYQHSTDSAYTTSGPIVHEGFIPAPGQEDDDDDEAYPARLGGYHQTLFGRDSDDDDDDSDDERAREEEEELLREIAEQDNTSEDSDYSVADADEEDPADDVIPLDELVDEDEEYESSRTRSSARGRGRGATSGRGRGRGRGKGRGRGRPANRGLESYRASGRPQRARRQRGGRAGPRAVVDPGPEFRELQRVANVAFVSKEYGKAIEYAKKAIEYNPEIFAPHSLLSEIYMELGEEQKAIEALILGAPTKRDKELWWHIIDCLERIDARTYPSFTPEKRTAMILGCLRAIIDLDGNDYNARLHKLDIEESLGIGHYSKAIKLCLFMLGLKPEATDLLKRMAKLTVATPNLTRIWLKRVVIAVEKSIGHFLANDRPEESGFSWDTLNLYLDLLELSGDHEKGLAESKRLSRWIQGRAQETYWDEQFNDCEFDIDDDRRRNVPEYEGAAFPEDSYGQSLMAEIRIKMGLFRLGMGSGHLEEALGHFEWLAPDDKSEKNKLNDYPDLFLQAAEALYQHGYKEEALIFFGPLYRIDSTDMLLKHCLHLHACYDFCGLRAEASELAQDIFDWRISTDDAEELALLAKFMEDHGKPDEAWETALRAYREGGMKYLQAIGYTSLADVQEVVWRERRLKRAEKAPRRRRLQTYMKALKELKMKPPGSAETGGNRGIGHAVDRASDAPRPTKPRLIKARPGTYKRKPKPAGREPRHYTMDQIRTIDGTEVPLDAFDLRYQAKRLKDLAEVFPEDLKAARAAHREIEASFRLLNELSDSAEEGDLAASNDWLVTAQDLVDEFTNFDLFYIQRYAGRPIPFLGYIRNLKGDLFKDPCLMVLAVIANKVEDGEDPPPQPGDLKDSFYGITFEHWVDMLCQYAILLTRVGDSSLALDTLSKARFANVLYYSKELAHRLEICRLACCLATEDSEGLVEPLRWLMRSHTFDRNLFRLNSIAHRMCGDPSGYDDHTTLKQILRYVRAVDWVVGGKRRSGDDGNHIGSLADAPQARFPAGVHPKLVESAQHFAKSEPALLGLYGHMRLSAGSIMSIKYYARIFKLTPSDAILNLCIGISYLEQAFNRLHKDQMNDYIQMGLPFVQRYYQLRTQDAVAAYCSEAEFNVGRVWHMIGLANLAVISYERCIALSQRVHAEAKASASDETDDGAEDFAPEAAYALSTLLAKSGDMRGARKVTEQYLVIE